MSVPRNRWRWFGCPGHFIAVSNCSYRLHKRVGNYRISTVGEYRPPGFTPSDAKPFEEIGWQRTFETMVFRVIPGEPDGCCPGEGSVAEWGGIDTIPYNDVAAAHRGHLAACEKYGRRAK